MSAYCQRMFKSHSAQFLIANRKPLLYALIAAFTLMLLGDIAAQMGLGTAASTTVLLAGAAIGGYRLGRRAPEPER